jgi:hypothetical protein
MRYVMLVAVWCLCAVSAFAQGQTLTLFGSDYSIPIPSDFKPMSESLDPNGYENMVMLSSDVRRETMLVLKQRDVSFETECLDRHKPKAVSSKIKRFDCTGGAEPISTHFETTVPCKTGTCLLQLVYIYNSLRRDPTLLDQLEDALASYKK